MDFSNDLLFIGSLSESSLKYKWYAKTVQPKSPILPSSGALGASAATNYCSYK